jgi:hypothetical protein
MGEFGGTGGTGPTGSPWSVARTRDSLSTTADMPSSQIYVFAYVRKLERPDFARGSTMVCRRPACALLGNDRLAGDMRPSIPGGPGRRHCRADEELVASWIRQASELPGAPLDVAVEAAARVAEAHPRHGRGPRPGAPIGGTRAGPSPKRAGDEDGGSSVGHGERAGTQYDAHRKDFRTCPRTPSHRRRT